MRDEKFARILWVLCGWIFGGHRLYIDAKALWAGSLASSILFLTNVLFVYGCVRLEGKDGHTALTVITVFTWLGGFVYWAIDGIRLASHVQAVNFRYLFRRLKIRPPEFAMDLARHSGNLKDITVAYLLWGMAGWWMAAHRFYLDDNAAAIGYMVIAFATAVMTVVVAAYRDVMGVDTSWWILFGFMMALWIAIVLWWSLDGGFMSRTIQTYNMRVMIDNGIDPQLAQKLSLDHRTLQKSPYLHVVAAVPRDQVSRHDLRNRYLRKQEEEHAITLAQSRRSLYRDRAEQGKPFSWREDVHRPTIKFFNELTDAIRRLFKGRGWQWRSSKPPIQGTEGKKPQSWEQHDKHVHEAQESRMAVVAASRPFAFYIPPDGLRRRPSEVAPPSFDVARLAAATRGEKSPPPVPAPASLAPQSSGVSIPDSEGKDILLLPDVAPFTPLLLDSSTTPTAVPTAVPVASTSTGAASPDVQALLSQFAKGVRSVADHIIQLW